MPAVVAGTSTVLASEKSVGKVDEVAKPAVVVAAATVTVVAE